MSDSDNEAPEDVTFSASKSVMMKQLKEQSESSNARKKKAKDLRKAREDLYKSQKEKKLQRLASLLPTEEELRQLPATLNDDPTSDTTESTTKTHPSSKTVFKDMDDEEDDGTDENYIGFSGTKFKVVHVRKEIESNLRSRVPNSLLNFRNTMLYGRGSNVKREAAEDVVRRKLKRKMIRS